MDINTATNSQTNFSGYFTENGSAGLTAIVWGTDSIGGGIGNFTYGTYGSYIVVSASDSKRVEEINIEQGTGFEAIVILLNKGEDIELEVIDDTSVIAPAIGTICTYSSRYGAANMLFVGDKTTQARKREGMRTLSFKTFNAIAGLH